MKNEEDFKVLVDTNVLVSASINQLLTKLNCRVVHQFNSLSQPLFDYFRSHVKKRMGVFTPEIENSAKRVLINAIDSEIKQMDNEDIKEKIKEIEVYSFILENSNTHLAENMNLLIREPIDEKGLTKITYEVVRLYMKLARELTKENPMNTINAQAHSLKGSLQGLAMGIYTDQEKESIVVYNKLSNKIEKDPLNLNDARILSQAIYFLRNKTYGEDTKILLASTDYHFSKVKESDGELSRFVPKNVYREFKVFCSWPDEILKIIKGESNIPYKD